MFVPCDPLPSRRRAGGSRATCAVASGCALATITQTALTPQALLLSLGPFTALLVLFTACAACTHARRCPVCVDTVEMVVCDCCAERLKKGQVSVSL